MRKKAVTLALQGGGSHGAFTWGVLDRLLEDERISIEGISGASAGSMNAVALAHGFVGGGREGARQALADFWESVAGKAPFAQLPEDLPTLVADGSPGHASPALKALVSLGRFFSPYQLNPFDINPLRDIVANRIDFERLRAESRIKLFIAATEVGTGRLRIFRNRELTLDHLLASACVPRAGRAALARVPRLPDHDRFAGADRPVGRLTRQRPLSDPDVADQGDEVRHRRDGGTGGVGAGVLGERGGWQAQQRQHKHKRCTADESSSSVKLPVAPLPTA